MSHPNESYLNSSSYELEEEIDIEHNNCSTDEVSIPNTGQQKSRQSLPKKCKPNTPFQDSLLDALLNPPFLSIPPSETDDPDKAFLLSFLPDIKKLNENQKLDLKFEFLQALRKIVSNTDSLNTKNSHSNDNNYFNPLILPPYQQIQQPQLYSHSPMLNNISNPNSYYSLPLNHLSQANVNNLSASPGQSNNKPPEPSDFVEL